MSEKIWDSPEIYRIPVVLPDNPLRYLNCYVIRTPERSMVIDTGFNRSECREALWAGLDELCLDWSRTILFLTHLHADHSGLVWDFIDRGVTVYMGRTDHSYRNAMELNGLLQRADERYIREGYPPENILLQVWNNQARLYASEAPFPATELEDGQELYLGALKLICVETPGHTPGHMMLYLPEEQLLFSGDNVLFDITPNVGIWDGVPSSLEDYLNSLHKTETLRVKHTFPAHRSVKGDVYERTKALIAHHEARLEEIMCGVREHPGSSGYELAGMITWSVRGLPWDKFPPHQRWFAMGETLSHLIYLEQHGRVRREETDGIGRYTAIE